MRKKILIHLVFALTIVSVFWHFIFNMHLQYGTDWQDYFEPLSLFVRSAVVHYQTLPIHNPWRCAGSDFLTNPQTRLFSPFVVADILMSPQWACLFSMLVLGFVGLWSMFKLLKYLDCSEPSSIIGAILFISSSWLGLHFSSGHITYAEMQLLPLVFLCGLRFGEKKFQFLLLSTLALILLNGSIQAFIYSGYILVCAAIVTRWQKTAANHAPIDRKYLAKLAGIFALVTAGKTIPVALSIGGRSPMLETTKMNGDLLFKTFLYPWQDLRLAVPGSPFSFHEFGCYLGWVALGLLLILLFSKKLRSENSPYIALLAFWLWTGTGLLSPINPWWLMQKIPIANQAHIQSRLLIIAFMFFIILVVKSLDRFKNKRIVWSTLVIFLLADGIFARLNSTRMIEESGGVGLTRNDLIKNDNTFETIMDGTLVEHYFKPNIAGFNCNDRAFYASDVAVKGASNYRGEVFFGEGEGIASYEKVGPGFFAVRYDATNDSKIVLNSNHLWGWKSRNPLTPVISKRFSNLITVAVPAGKGLIELDYRPKYLYPTLLIFLVGLVLYFRELRRQNFY